MVPFYSVRLPFISALFTTQQSNYQTLPLLAKTWHEGEYSDSRNKIQEKILNSGVYPPDKSIHKE